jgi:hypothetical protein
MILLTAILLVALVIGFLGAIWTRAKGGTPHIDAMLNKCVLCLDKLRISHRRRNELPQIIQQQPRLRRHQRNQTFHLPVVLIARNGWRKRQVVVFPPYPYPSYNLIGTG